MQATQPWTAPYSREFMYSKRGDDSPSFHSPYLRPERHRSLMHDLMHVTKAIGVLASIAEWADHGSIRTQRVDQDEYEGRIADLIMCALHMANNPPEGYAQFDLERAVIERVERVNGVSWTTEGAVNDFADSPSGALGESRELRAESGAGSELPT